MNDDAGEMSSSDSEPASIEKDRLMVMAERAWKEQLDAARASATNNDGAEPIDLVASAVGEKDAIDLLGAEDKMLRIISAWCPRSRFVFMISPLAPSSVRIDGTW